MPPEPADRREKPSARLLGWWHGTPLYWRIVGAVLLGGLLGVVLGRNAEVLQIPSQLVLRVLGALAPPLILLAIIQALLQAQIPASKAFRLAGLLLVNTLVAIAIGLTVANVVRPGYWTESTPPPTVEKTEHTVNPLVQFLDNVPKSLLGPLGDDGKVLGVIFLAVALGIALRRLRHHEIKTVEDVVHVALNSLVVVLHWIIDVIPLAVLGIVASIVGTKGFADFLALGGFILAVILGLALQATYYMLRVRFGSWVRPVDLLRGTRDALVMAFSTGSSTATMPVTYACLREKVGLSNESASLGALVGSNFNNDGTALYEAMAALFVAQLTGAELSVTQQFLVVATSVVASVGAAGIPEAGLVTMTMVFSAVGLPKEYIAMLLTVDWLLDRCRTTINVMGDTTISCLLDGPTKPAAETPGLGIQATGGVVEPATQTATLKVSPLKPEA